MSTHDAFGGERLAQGDLDRLAARTRRALDWRHGLGGLRGEGRAHGIRAVCDAGGHLVDLSVPDSACADGGRALAESVLDALMAAREDVADQVAASARAEFGEDSSEAETITSSWTAGLARRPQAVTADARDGRGLPGAPDEPPGPPADRW